MLIEKFGFTTYADVFADIFNNEYAKTVATIMTNKKTFAQSNIIYGGAFYVPITATGYKVPVYDENAPLKSFRGVVHGKLELQEK